MVTLSVVSHNQGSLVNKLLDSLSLVKSEFEVIVTSNTYEENDINLNRNFNCLYLQNKIPKGFGHNHNIAFLQSKFKYFCVLNPDILFLNDVFPQLLQILEDNSLSLVAPHIINVKHEIDDSYRSFLTPKNLFLRILKLEKYNPHFHKGLIYPDWIAGMFMLFKSSEFRKLRGFNISYFMYCEDMDFCFRMKSKSLNYAVVPSQRVLHEARRASRTNLKHIYWHLKSVIIFWYYFYKNK